MAAVSSTTAALYISRKDFSTQTPMINGAISTNSITFATKLRRVHIRSSGEFSADTSATDQADSSENPIEASKEPPSLISALNVERALRGIPITDVDHYGRLGLQRGCSSEQVTVAYQRKVEEMRNQGLNEEELDNRLELLKESYIILSSEEERRMYDWSLARSQDVERYVWPFEVDKTKTPKESPPMLQEPEDVGPTRFVGYFILGWLILPLINKNQGEISVFISHWGRKKGIENLEPLIFYYQDDKIVVLVSSVFCTQKAFPCRLN